MAGADAGGGYQAPTSPLSKPSTKIGVSSTVTVAMSLALATNGSLAVQVAELTVIGGT